MSSELYAIISMAARYFFCGLMVLIVFRAWRVTVVDNRRARLMRNWSPETGCIGELVIDPGKARRQVSVPVPREGVLGCARSADICIRHKDVRRDHLSFEQRVGGLLIKPRGRAPVLLNKREAGEELFMRDGDTLTLGGLKLLLVMFDAADQSAEDDFSDEALWGEPDMHEQAAALPAPSTPRKRPSGHALQAFEEELWPDE